MVAIVGAAADSRPDLRILLVKTSSLGDVVHNLPVVSDIHAHFPHAQIDWLVEEGFADIPRLHPAVGKVIPVALRRWRKQLLQTSTWQEISALRRALQTHPYDLVIDTQGLLKSALLTGWAYGVRHGYAPDSIREPMAAHFYNKRHSVSKDLHAVVRNRQLVAAALGYELAGGLNYGLGAPTLTPALSPQGRGSEANAQQHARYAVLLTATSRDDKLWPEADWVALAQQLQAHGIECVFPAGSAIEQARAARIAAQCGGRTVPPMGIAALAELMQSAQLIVGVDTGLTHLGAALGRPTAAIFCATEPALTGVFAPQAVLNLGGKQQAPTPAQVWQAIQSWLS